MPGPRRGARTKTTQSKMNKKPVKKKAVGKKVAGVGGAMNMKKLDKNSKRKTA